MPSAEVLAPNVLAAKHLTRIAGGLLYAATSRVPWAILLKRTFDLDVSRCARCGGTLRGRAVLTDRAVAADILASLQNKRSRASPTVAVSRHTPKRGE